MQLAQDGHVAGMQHLGGMEVAAPQPGQLLHRPGGGFITGGIASKHCFVAGTLIHTEDGLVPIEEIKPDQLVWAEDPETGERALKRVVCLFRNEKYELVHLQVNGETITTTVGHPFFVQGKGWVLPKICISTIS